MVMLGDIIPPINKEAGDYSQDGVLYCGQCKEPKQAAVDLKEHGGVKLLPRQCRCQREVAEAERKSIEAARARMKNDDIIRSGYADSSYLNDTFQVDDGKQPKVTQDLKRYVSKWQEMKEQNIGLLFLGPCGSGKTFFASCIANAIREQYLDFVLITTLTALIAKMSRNFGDQSVNAERQLMTYPLVVIDDLGVERDTTFVNEKVENIINIRCRAKLPLIVTTNLSLEDLKATKDIRQARITSRLSEMCVPYAITGSDRRRPRGQSKVTAAREQLGF